jgi:hypothetical protein
MLRHLLDRLRPAPPVRLRLYTRASCPLCDEMKAELSRARPAHPFVLEEVDIAGDPELLERFGLSIPVLEIAGRVAFKGRWTAAQFEEKLARRVRELARADGREEVERDG